MPGKQRGRQIDYRHLIGSLARKPMAFYHAELRDDILPNAHWYQLWQQCNQSLTPRQACYLIVGALNLAATHDNEDLVAATLLALLNDESQPSLLILQKCLGLASTDLTKATVVQESKQHDLGSYDNFLKQAGDAS